MKNAILIVSLMILSQGVLAQNLFSFKVNATCSVLANCQNSLLNSGHMQVAVYPDGYTCESDVSLLSKSQFLMWGSGLSVSCANAQCLGSIDQFRFNRGQDGVYSIRVEIYSHSDPTIGVVACENNLSVLDGGDILISNDWADVQIQ